MPSGPSALSLMVRELRRQPQGEEEPPATPTFPALCYFSRRISCHPFKPTETHSDTRPLIATNSPPVRPLLLSGLGLLEGPTRLQSPGGQTV